MLHKEASNKLGASWQSKEGSRTAASSIILAILSLESVLIKRLGLDHISRFLIFREGETFGESVETMQSVVAGNTVLQDNGRKAPFAETVLLLSRWSATSG